MTAPVAGKQLQRMETQPFVGSKRSTPWGSLRFLYKVESPKPIQKPCLSLPCCQESNREWHQLTPSGDAPEGRNSGCSAITPSGVIWAFGGASASSLSLRFPQMSGKGGPSDRPGQSRSGMIPNSQKQAVFFWEFALRLLLGRPVDNRYRGGRQDSVEGAEG